MPSTPRSVFVASASACAAASLQDSVDTPTRSIVLMTDIAPPSLEGLPLGGGLVHFDHAAVVLRDALRRGSAVPIALQPGGQGIPPDRPPDGEPDVAGHTGAGSEPVGHRRLVRPPAQDHARDAVASGRADLFRDPLAVRRRVDAFDLP